MRIVIQRVKRASVSVEEKVVGSIQKGFLVLIGVGQGDDEASLVNDGPFTVILEDL